MKGKEDFSCLGQYQVNMKKLERGPLLERTKKGGQYPALKFMEGNFSSGDWAKQARNSTKFYR
jgi:hypothetical protein